MAAADAQVAMARAPEADDKGRLRLRAQPVFCLLRQTLLESLTRFTHEGGRKIDAWTAGHRLAYADFDRPGDDPRAFFNANTLAELHALQGP
jgi:molybdopterin-guanine dinucleotide biosynthesis protein A